MSDRFVLASQSAARKAVLAAAGVSFQAEAARVDEAAIKLEHLNQGASPPEVARILAEAKAVEVSTRLDGLVLGADQTLDLDGRLFDKPSSVDDLRSQLLELRGRTHVLHAGLAAARSGALVWRHEGRATLTMRSFSNAFLDDYLTQEGEAVQACVGGYRLEGLGAQLFDRIEGDYFTILGLPLLPVLGLLRREGLATV
ncbi:MAG: Maf family protein [Caulobacteraceae bacterium]